MKTSGTIWISAVLSLPLLGAIAGSSIMINWTDDTWRWRSIVWIALGLGVPLACALVHTRQPGIIVFTLLVGLTTYPAFRHLRSGPQVADTVVVAFHCQVRERHGVRCIEERLTLADGREVFIDAARVAHLRTGDPVRVMTMDDVVLRIDKT